MRKTIANALTAVANLIRGKSAPSALLGNQWTGTSYVDAYKRNRTPTPNELLAELKATAFTCASINAAVCANFPPKLYLSTEKNQPQAKWNRKSLDRHTERRIRSSKTLPVRFTKAEQLEEIIEHPLLTLLHQVNPVHNAFDLWELTTLYQEVHGSAYWMLNFDPLGVPTEVWILPSQKAEKGTFMFLIDMKRFFGQREPR